MPGCSSKGKQVVLVKNPVKRKIVKKHSGNEKVTFKVGKKHFTLEKQDVIGRSPVFKAMFNHQFSKPDNTVDITGISPSTFEYMLKGFSKEIPYNFGIPTIEDAILTLHAAHQYNVEIVEYGLTKYLLKEIYWKNVLQILPHAELMNSCRLRSKCWSVIEKQTTKVIGTPEFLNVSWNFLVSVLENSRLVVNEFLLFKSVYKWCIAQSQSNKTGLKDVLGVAIYKVRFPLMSIGEFDSVKNMRLLAEGEIADLEADFRQNTTFPCTPRRNVCFCNKNKLSCSLCVRNGRKSPIHPLTIRQLDLLPMQYHQCECRKYESCPSFPNGTAAEILGQRLFQ